MHLFDNLRKEEEQVYDSLPGDPPTGSEILENTHCYTPPNRDMCGGTALPWSVSAILFIELAIVSLRTESSMANGGLGTYESGFVTDIGKTPVQFPVKNITNCKLEPTRAAIALKKKKFYGGIHIDGNGSYSLSMNPDATNFFAPPNPEVDAAWMEEMLHGKGPEK